MDEKYEHCRIQNWYPRLSVYSLPTNFVFLMDIEIQALQNGDTESGIAKGVIDRLASAMSKFPFTRFVGIFFVYQFFAFRAVMNKVCPQPERKDDDFDDSDF